MKTMKWFLYSWRILWVIGFVLLMIVKFNVENHLQQEMLETYTILYILWSNLFISIVLGIYLSVLFIKKWSLAINPPLLWSVAVPCMLLALSFPVWMTLANYDFFPERMANVRIPMWLIKVHSSNIVGMVASLTFILSIFNGSVTNENSTTDTR